MKRLIKSEFFDANKFRDITYECFKNPTSKEWNEIVKLDEGVRGVITKGGTVYLWCSKLLHFEAEELFTLEDGLHYDSDSNETICFYITQNITAEYVQEALRNASSLYNYFSKDTKTFDFDTQHYEAEHSKMYQDVMTIQHIIDYDFNEEE